MGTARRRSPFGTPPLTGQCTSRRHSATRHSRLVPLSSGIASQYKWIFRSCGGRFSQAGSGVLDFAHGHPPSGCAQPGRKCPNAAYTHANSCSFHRHRPGHGVTFLGQRRCRRHCDSPVGTFTCRCHRVPPGNMAIGRRHQYGLRPFPSARISGSMSFREEEDFLFSAADRCRRFRHEIGDGGDHRCSR